MTRLLAILLLLPAIASAAGLGVYNPAQHAVNGFMPTQLGDCAMWFDAGRAGYTNNTTVSNWDDFSGNARNVTNATSSKSPTFRNASAGGRSALYFDGTDDFLSRSSIAPSLQQPITSFHVGAITYQAVGNGYSPYIFDADTSTNRVTSIVNGEGTAAGTNQLMLFAGGTGLQTSNRLLSGVWYVRSDLFSRSNSLVRINGQNWDFKTTGDIGTNIMVSISIGNSFGKNTSQGAYLGHYSELIVFKRLLSSQERLQVERYLGTKYGIVVQ